MNVVIIIVVALFTSITAPLVLAYLTAAQHRRDREADWDRQDKQAAEANRKLDSIHVLVNGAMTAAMKSELEAVQRELAMMREMISIRQGAGQDPSPDTIRALQATEAKAATLADALAQREEAVKRSQQP